MISGARVVFVDREFAHHGQYAGYKQLMRYLPGSPVTTSVRVPWLPERLLYRLPGASPHGYNRPALELELSVLTTMAPQKRAIYHYLYGEMSFRLAAHVNRVLRHKHRVVVTYHQPPGFFEQWGPQLGRLQLRSVDAVLLVASNQRAIFDDLARPDRVHVIPHGVDVDFFRPVEERPAAVGRLTCLSVGSNFRDVELHRQVIEQTSAVAGGMIKFVVIGEASLAGQYAGLAHVRYASGISDQELLAAYHAADLQLLPLADATACNALLESLACGLPTIVTDVGGVRDYVDETCAVLVPAGDARACTAALLALAADTDRRAALGRRARARAEQSLDWRAVARRVAAVYERIE
jgi:glycosyltransferase involved in cell wall biosynthesis